jgi:hypothetical protein
MATADAHSTLGESVNGTKETVCLVVLVWGRQPRQFGTFLTQCMSGRALQGIFLSTWQVMVLHQCIRPLVGALLRAIMDISARAISLADRP